MVADEPKNTSITFPAWMVEEIRDRREKGTSRSKYIRDAIRARFDAEDAGEWVAPSDDPDSEHEATAD